MPFAGSPESDLARAGHTSEEAWDHFRIYKRIVRTQLRYIRKWFKRKSPSVNLAILRTRGLSRVMSGQPFAGSRPGYRIMWIGGVAVRRNRIHRLPNSRRFNLGSWLLPTLGSENGFLKVEGLPLASEGHLDGRGTGGDRFAVDRHFRIYSYSKTLHYGLRR